MRVISFNDHGVFGGFFHELHYIRSLSNSSKHTHMTYQDSGAPITTNDNIHRHNDVTMASTKNFVHVNCNFQLEHPL